MAVYHIYSIGHVTMFSLLPALVSTLLPFVHCKGILEGT